MQGSDRSINMWRMARRAVIALGAIAAVSLAAVQDAPSTSVNVSSAVPAFRQADKVAIITVEGGIDRVTELSVKRRIRQAEESGADAMVIEIDSPGGEVGAVLEISNAIKGSSIANTVAWVNPDAYSGGAIIALACREIVTSSPASMGDAFPITMRPGGIRGLTADERTKILPPLLSDVADSARRSGFDEYVVQAIVVDGIELWAVREAVSGRWIFINEAEYRVLFDGDPPRGKPVLTSVPGGRRASENSAANPAARAETEPAADEPGDDAREEAGAGGGLDRAGDSPARDTADGDSADGESPARESPDGVDPEPAVFDRPADMAFLPANPSVADLAEAISDGITEASDRPQFSMADRGKYVDPLYVCDGTGPIVMRDDQLRRFGLAAAQIETDAELQAFFGATVMTRTNQSWSETMVGVMTSLPVRGLLIAVFVIALFIEMASPGLFIAGGVAAAALVGLIAPPALIGMAGWWEIVAIVAGFGCILVEVLVIPGFGVFGIVGIVLMFTGLVGTFIPDGAGSLFPQTAAEQSRLIGALATVLLAFVTGGIGVYFVSKHFGSLPLVNRLVLDAARDSEREESGDGPLLQAAAPPPLNEPQPGDFADTITALRPSGRVRVQGRSEDALARRGVIDAGVRVRLVERRGFSWVVEAAVDGGPSAAGEGDRVG